MLQDAQIIFYVDIPKSLYTMYFVHNA